MHDHGHDHGTAHHHHHAPASFGMAFAVGIALNGGFVLLEAGYGLFSNSLALLADAGHNASDVLGLVVAWIATVLSRRPPSARYSYGFRGSSILAALFNAAFLLVAVGAIGWESIVRLYAPEPVAGSAVMAVAAAGIVVNGVTAWLFASGRKGDLNIRGAYLHMLADAAVSAGVVVAGGVIYFTGWLWLDPLASLVIVAVILRGAWQMLRESLDMSLGAVPAGIEPGAVSAFLKTQAGIADVHDLHIWPMSTTEIAMTSHLVMPGGHPGDAFIHRTAAELGRRFGIGHVALQIETSGVHCPLAPDHVI